MQGDDWLDQHRKQDPGSLYGEHVRFLVLDDDPNRVHAFRCHLGAAMMHVHSARDCIRALESHAFQVAFLDHDLEMSITHYGCLDHGSGTHVVTHLWDQRHVAAGTLFVVHSMNSDCAGRMVETLRDGGRRATQRASAWLDAADLKAIAMGAPWPVSQERAVHQVAGWA